MNSKLDQVLIAGGLLILWAPAHAYIDPGTGSALIAALVAAFAAIYTTAKLYWHRFVGLFGSKNEKDKPIPSDGEAED